MWPPWWAPCWPHELCYLWCCLCLNFSPYFTRHKSCLYFWLRSEIVVKSETAPHHCGGTELRIQISRVLTLNTSSTSDFMMTSSNGNIFRVTGHLCGEFTGPRWIPRTKAIDAELWCFCDLRLNKRVSKQSWGWRFETLPRPLWRHSIVGGCPPYLGFPDKIYSPEVPGIWSVSQFAYIPGTLFVGLT